MPRNRFGYGQDKTPPPNGPIEPIASLTASRNIDVVKEVIRVKYGFVPPDKFASDLVDFVEALTDGQ